LVFTPVGIAISDLERIKVIFATPGFGLGLILLSIVSAGVFTQSGAPLIYIIPPILIVAATIGGIRGAALAVVALFLTTAPLTLMGYGPIHFTTPDYTQSMLRYQLFLGANTIVALSAGLLTSQRKELMRKLASAEREYRTLVEKSNDITLRYSPGGIISYASRAVKSLGVSSEEVIGQPLTDFMKPVGDSSQSTGEAKFPNVDAKTPQQFKVTCKNGNIIWLEGNPKAIRNKAGQVVEIISTFRNVTERHEREVALAAAKCAAEQAANTKMEFLSNMSHEIRTPMNGVLGMAQVLSETQLSHVQREYVELILDSGGSLLTILNNILDLSKIEADMMSINLCPIDLREIAEIFRNLYKPNAKKKGVLFDVHVHNSVPDSIMADPVRVKQCIENLITNALKFTPQGSVQVVISADKKNYNTHTIKIHVADTGIGMSKQTTHDVFKPFTQADGSSTRIYGGTGLGLPIARKLAKIMGGDLTVISRLDHGSVFVFTFTAPIAADSYSGNIVHIPIIRARSNTRHLPTISHGQ
jgi:PAS domain S-box-containing protein